MGGPSLRTCCTIWYEEHPLTNCQMLFILDKDARPIKAYTISVGKRHTHILNSIHKLSRWFDFSQLGPSIWIFVNLAIQYKHCLELNQNVRNCGSPVPPLYGPHKKSTPARDLFINDL